MAADKPQKRQKKATSSPTPEAASPAPAPAPAVTAGQKPAKQEVVLIGGMPAGGKSTLTRSYTDRGFQRLNRDTVGGAVDDLLPRLDALLAAGASVVLDNLYATRASREGAVKLAKKHGVPVRFVLQDTSLEDAQFNACLRMVERCGKVLHPEDHKQAAYRDDPNLFPVAVLYRYRKEFQEPTTAEGFAAVEEVKFVRQYPAEWKNKAAIFDLLRALVRDGAMLFEQCETARLTMRPFSDTFLEAYLDEMGAAVTASVGGYQLEKAGVQLFDRIEGDHFVVLGLPLLPVLRFLRDAGCLAP